MFETIKKFFGIETFDTDVIKMTRRELNKEISKAYVNGFYAGKRSERMNMVYRKYTPNEIREALGLPPIEYGGETDV